MIYNNIKKLFKRTEQRDIEAQLNSVDDLTPTDLKKAFNSYKKAAKKGSIAGQIMVSFYYEHGCGTKQNFRKSIYWTEKAAEQGFLGSQIALAYKYQYDLHFPNYEKAIYWCRKAVEQGSSEAEFALGGFYKYGNGVPKDYEKAYYWYKKAADHGDEIALGIVDSDYISFRDNLRQKTTSTTKSTHTSGGCALLLVALFALEIFRVLL